MFSLIPVRLPGFCLALACASLFYGCTSQRTSADTRVYRMGERAEAGSLVYNAIEADWHDELGEGVATRRPQTRFLAVRLSVTNSGNKTANVPAMVLVDSKGQTYPELSDGEGLPEWLGFLRMLKPAETEHGRVLFDVPTGAYKLRISDESDPDKPKAALIDIPLQLAPDPVKMPGTDALQK
jgi:hypothetical protein